MSLIHIEIFCQIRGNPSRKEMTPIGLDTELADKAVKVLRVKSRTEAVHMALREIVVFSSSKN